MRMRKPLAVALLAFVLAGCAHHHRRTGRTIPSPPSGIPQLGATETGLASWYGHPYHGRPAADGEIYDMETLVAAHRTLPFNTWVRVVNLTNDKSVEVRIIDRGPFVDGRIIDLSHAAATAIDMIGSGTAHVRIEVISAPATAVGGACSRCRWARSATAPTPSASAPADGVALRRRAPAGAAARIPASGA